MNLYFIFENYFNFRCKLLNEASGKYGDNIIEEYSKKLISEVCKKYNKRTLFRMNQFYNLFNDEKA